MARDAKFFDVPLEGYPVNDPGLAPLPERPFDTTPLLQMIVVLQECFGGNHSVVVNFVRTIFRYIFVEMAGKELAFSSELALSLLLKGGYARDQAIGILG